MTKTGAIVVAAYDGTSRVPGASLGARELLSGLADAGLPADAARLRLLRDDSKSSALWGRRLLELALHDEVVLTLGGEHLVTFPIVEGLLRRHPDLKLVVFDAHHDAYVHPLLTHYSLFHHLASEFGVPTLIVGVRHELEKCSPLVQQLPMRQVSELGVEGVDAHVRAFVGTSPFYWSIDLDVLEPGDFPGVSDRVPGGMGVPMLRELTARGLARGPVAVDLVEYNPLRQPEQASAMASLKPLLEEVAQWAS